MDGSSKGVCVLLTLAAVLFLSGGLAWAQSLNGNMCFDVRITEDHEGPADMASKAKMHAVAQDKIHSTVSGVMQFPDDGPFVMTGMAVVQGKSIFINLTVTQAHTSEPWKDTGIMQIRLNSATMKGSIWTIGHDFNTQNREFDSTYAAGDIAKAACK